MTRRRRRLISSIPHCGRWRVEKQNIPFQLRRTASSVPPRGPSIWARRAGCPCFSYSLDAPDDVPVRRTAEDAQGLKFAEALPMQWALHVLAVRQVTESVCIRRPNTQVPPLILRRRPRHSVQGFFTDPLKRHVKQILSIVSELDQVERLQCLAHHHL